MGMPRGDWRRDGEEVALGLEMENVAGWWIVVRELIFPRQTMIARPKVKTVLHDSISARILHISFHDTMSRLLRVLSFLSRGQRVD